MGTSAVLRNTFLDYFHNNISGTYFNALDAYYDNVCLLSDSRGQTI